MYHDDGDKFWIEDQGVLFRGNMPREIWSKIPMAMKAQMLSIAAAKPHVIEDRLPMCAYCDEPVFPGERRGPILNAITHHECAFRMMAGSVGHQQGLCSCKGKVDMSEIGLSKRHAARLSWAYYLANQ